MSSYPGPAAAARPGDTAGTLRLLAYLALAVTLLVLDHRDGWLHQARAQAGLLVDVPAQAVHEAEKAASDALRSMAIDGPSGIVVDAYRKMRRDLGVTAANHASRNIDFV